jgi:hypothetical protein
VTDSHEDELERRLDSAVALFAEARKRVEELADARASAEDVLREIRSLTTGLLDVLPLLQHGAALSLDNEQRLSALLDDPPTTSNASDDASSSSNKGDSVGASISRLRLGLEYLAETVATREDLLLIRDTWSKAPQMDALMRKLDESLAGNRSLLEAVTHIAGRQAELDGRVGQLDDLLTEVATGMEDVYAALYEEPKSDEPAQALPTGALSDSRGTAGQVEPGGATVRDFLEAKSPASRIEAATCIAYWWAVQTDRPISSAKLGELNRETGLPLFSDPASTAQAAARTRRWMERAKGPGLWRVTSSGRDLVESLPDRQVLERLPTYRT